MLQMRLDVMHGNEPHVAITLLLGNGPLAQRRHEEAEDDASEKAASVPAMRVSSNVKPGAVS